MTRNRAARPAIADASSNGRITAFDRIERPCRLRAIYMNDPSRLSGKIKNNGVIQRDLIAEAQDRVSDSV